MKRVSVHLFLTICLSVLDPVRLSHLRPSVYLFLTLSVSVTFDPLFICPSQSPSTICLSVLNRCPSQSPSTIPSFVLIADHLCHLRQSAHLFFAVSVSVSFDRLQCPPVLPSFCLFNLNLNVRFGSLDSSLFNINNGFFLSIC